MANGHRIGARNVPGVDGYSGVWTLREIADAARKGAWLADPFDSNSGAYYTQHGDVIGTWVISASELVATSGTNSLFIRNDQLLADGAIEADINHCQDGGLILRFVDNSNYYLLLLSDDSGAAPSANIRIYKRVAGTFTQLGSTADITWTRGPNKTIRFSAIGTTLKAFADGVEVISVTDSAFAGPGGFGMRNHTNFAQTRFQAFRWGA